MTPRSPSKPKTPERRAAELLGRHGETIAAWFLRFRGYRIRDMRVKTKVGEIDIVAERFGVTAFVEVKTRTRATGDFDPVLAVDRARIRRRCAASSAGGSPARSGGTSGGIAAARVNTNTTRLASAKPPAKRQSPKLSTGCVDTTRNNMAGSANENTKALIPSTARSGSIR